MGCVTSTTGVRTRSSTPFQIVLLISFLALLSASAFAQEATIVGTVTDPSGAAVANVNVTINHVETGTSRKITTNPEGQYVAPNLGIGHYNIRVDASGFKPIEQKNVVLAVGDRARFDFKLEIGTAQEQVTVEAGTVAVQTESGEVSNVITGQQVSALATNGRSIYTLINLTTGSSSLQGDFQTPTPVGGDANVSFNGARQGHNIYLLDGGENLDRGGSGTFSVMPSLESLAEFRTLTSNYSADYGLSSAATMTTVLKSGTKTFHASAWEYLRNDALDARNYFNRTGDKAKLRFNTYGFNVGGQLPFAKEHPTFFFYNMEWRSLIGAITRNQAVPFTSTYGGDFTGHIPADVTLSKDIDPAETPIPLSGFHVPCASQLSAAQQQAFISAGITTFSTPFNGSCSADPKKPLNQQPTFVAWPTTGIPAALLSANAQAMLKAGIFPAPTEGNKFIGGANTPTKVREEIVRIDHQFSSKFSIFGHWISEQINQGFDQTMWSGDNVPTVGNNFGNPSYSAVVHATHIISPTLLNEIAFNYNGNRINITPTGVFEAPSDFTFNRVFNGDNPLNRIPSVQLTNTGTNYQSNWVPWKNKADSYQFRDDVSWTRGNHQFKIGGSYQLYKKIQNLFAPTQGSFQFNGFYTGNDFADMLLGYSNQYQENALQDSGYWNNYSLAAYIQDNWRVTPRLTLNLGLRWDGAPHTYEANNRMANFYPNLYDQSKKPIFNADGTISASSPGLGGSPTDVLQGYQFYLNGVGISGKNGIPKGLVDDAWANFGPRVGFAYDVTGRGKTVIRGGFGTMFERIQGNDMYNAGGTVPFSSLVTLNNVYLDNPKKGVATGTVITVPPLPILVSDITGLNKDMYKMPVSYQYSIGVQQELGEKSVLSVSYVGMQGRHQNDYRQINLPDQSLLPGLVNDKSTFNQVVPYQGFGSIRLAQNEQNAHYNSLQTSLHSVVKKDLTLDLGYTLSRAIDPSTGTGNGMDLNNVSNPYVGWKYDVGPSVFDRTHVFFANFVYDLPFFRHSASRAVRTVAGGWQVSGIVSVQSGAPLNITVSGNNVSSVLTNTGNRPDLVGDIKYPHTVDQWFDPSAFAAPAAGTWGNLGHNALRGPGRHNWNMSLFKSFVFSETRGSRLEFRADAFNVWNHTQFRGDIQGGGISTALGNTDFGAITSAFDPRTLQLGMKLVF